MSNQQNTPYLLEPADGGAKVPPEAFFATEAWFDVLLRLNRRPTDELVLVLDPGETTGVAIFEDARLVQAGQIVVKEAFGKLRYIIESVKPDILVMEEYRIYQHKAMYHSYSTVPTLRYIGALQMLALIHNADVVFQSAARAKGFCTDEKLEKWGFWSNVSLHANDAIRHGCSFFLFNDRARRPKPE